MKNITAKLDSIATQLELSGQKKLAEALDTVSNELERQAAFEERRAEFIKELDRTFLNKLPEGSRDALRDTLVSVFGRPRIKNISSVAVEDNGLVLVHTNGEFSEPLPTANKQDVEHLRQFVMEPEKFVNEEAFKA